MTKSFALKLLLFVAIVLGGCHPKNKGIPEHYLPMLDEAFKKAGANAIEIEKALYDSPFAQREGMAFIISYMPEHDLQTLSAAFLLDNAHYAFYAREKFPWGRELPDSVFFNDVLPYVILNETRDNWRKDFFERFSRYLEGVTTIEAAVDTLNKVIRDEVLVDYSTKRDKPDQSPYESMRINMASCSGLSILLTDAFRAVAIPSRIAGTPNWHDMRGNHNWNEVWIGGEWYFTEYYPSGLNQSWFLADAGKADPDNPETSIYASSWRTTGRHFPLVWARSNYSVPGINVTERYLAIYQADEAQRAGNLNKVAIEVRMFRNGSARGGDERIRTRVELLAGKDTIDFGYTSGPTHDMNDVLTFYVDQHSDFALAYTDFAGEPVKQTVKSGVDRVQIELNFEE